MLFNCFFIGQHYITFFNLLSDTSHSLYWTSLISITIMIYTSSYWFLPCLILHWDWFLIFFPCVLNPIFFLLLLSYLLTVLSLCDNISPWLFSPFFCIQKHFPRLFFFTFFNFFSITLFSSLILFVLLVFILSVIFFLFYYFFLVSYQKDLFLFCQLLLSSAISIFYYLNNSCTTVFYILLLLS